MACGSSQTLPSRLRGTRARPGRNSLVLGLIAVAVCLAAASGMQRLMAKDLCSADPPSAFIAGSSPRSLLNRRMLHPATDDPMSASPIVMHGSSRRQNRYNYPKKLHPRGLQANIRWKMMHIPLAHGAFSAASSKEPTLETWSQTLIQVIRCS